CNASFFIFFFFQAEDGIRDFHVTGVQTCALPISSASASAPQRPSCSAYTASRPVSCCRALLSEAQVSCSAPGSPAAPTSRNRSRSEERRVGKECSSRWPPYQYIQKSSSSSGIRPS